MPKNKFFTICYGVILVLVIIWLASQVSFIFAPIRIAVETMLIPFILAGILYYILRPAVEWLHGYKVPRSIAILIMFLVLVGVLMAFCLAVGPIFQQQLNRLIVTAPKIADLLWQQWLYFQENQASFPSFVNNWFEQATQYVQVLVASIGRNLANILSGITSFILTLIIVPFILFYLLKDGPRFSEGLLRWVPQGKREEAQVIIGDMSRALSTYVLGQMVVSLCVGTMVFIGYSLIGLDYSLILAFVAMLTNLIPFVGPLIGAIPALAVGLIDSPWMMFKALLVVLAAQQIESNVISPQIMGRALDVHPLTIILLLLVAGSLSGVVGMILAVPLYALTKVVVKHSYRLYQLRMSGHKG
jgi:predicted PurR-regulated permease PerM